MLNRLNSLLEDSMSDVEIGEEADEPIEPGVVWLFHACFLDMPVAPGFVRVHVDLWAGAWVVRVVRIAQDVAL